MRNTQDYFGEIFPLRTDANIKNIWKCIQDCFNDTIYSKYFDELSKRECKEKNDFMFCYSCPTEQQPWVEFTFHGVYHNQNIFVQIVFDIKKLLLLLEEKSNTNEPRIFYHNFLSKLRQYKMLKDKAYPKIIHDTDGVLLPISMINGGIKITKKIADNTLSQDSEDYLKYKPYRHLLQRIWENKEYYKIIFSDVSKSHFNDKIINNLIMWISKPNH